MCTVRSGRESPVAMRSARRLQQDFGLLIRDGLDGKASLTQQDHLLQAGYLLDLVQREARGEGVEVLDIDRIPTRVFGRGFGVKILALRIKLRRVRVSGGRHLGESDYARGFAL